MKVAFISDLHANYEALSVLTSRLMEADMIMCLGDLTGYYCQVNEVVDWVRETADVCVLGNHDLFVLKGCPSDAPPGVRFGIEHAAASLEPGHLEWLRGLPHLWGGEIGGKTVLLSHGSPWDPMRDYLYADSPKLDELDAFAFDVIAFGQTHRRIERQRNGRLLLNPGAVGQSRDVETLGCATAAFVDFPSLKVTQVAEPYDTSKVLGLARACGASDWIAKHLVA